MVKVIDRKKTVVVSATGITVITLIIFFLGSAGEGSVEWAFAKDFIQDTPTHFHLIGNITLKDYGDSITLSTDKMSVIGSKGAVRTSEARSKTIKEEVVDLYQTTEKSFKCDYTVSDSLSLKSDKTCIQELETPNGTKQQVLFDKAYKGYNDKTQTFLYDEKSKIGTATIEKPEFREGDIVVKNGESITVRYDMDVPFNSAGEANLTVCFIVDGEEICEVLDPFWNSTVYWSAIPFTFTSHLNTTNVTLKLRVNLTEAFGLGYVNENASNIAFGNTTDAYLYFNYYWDDASGGYNNLTQDAENATFYVQIPQVNGSTAGLTNTFYLYLNNQSAAFDYSTGDVFWMNDSFEDGDWTTGVNWYYAERFPEYGWNYITEGVSSVPYDGSLAFSMEGINVYGWGFIGFWFNSTDKDGHGKNYPYSSVTVESALRRSTLQKTRQQLMSSNYTAVVAGAGLYDEYLLNLNSTGSVYGVVDQTYSIRFVYTVVSKSWADFAVNHTWFRHKTSLSTNGWAYVEAENLNNGSVASQENASFRLDSGKPLSYSNYGIFLQGGSHAIQEGISYYDSIFVYHDLPNVSIAQGNIESTDETPPVLTWAWGRNITSNINTLNITVNTNEDVIACNLELLGALNLSMTQNTSTQFYKTAEVLDEINYTVYAFCNDTKNNTGSTSLAWYKYDSTVYCNSSLNLIANYSCLLNTGGGSLDITCQPDVFVTVNVSANNASDNYTIEIECEGAQTINLTIGDNTLSEGYNISLNLTRNGSIRLINRLPIENGQDCSYDTNTNKTFAVTNYTGCLFEILALDSADDMIYLWYSHKWDWNNLPYLVQKSILNGNTYYILHSK